jgi:hypothetical protein
MSEKTQKQRRRFMRETLAEKINGGASRVLKHEIFRLARNRDILGILLIIASVSIITLLILLYRHW